MSFLPEWPPAAGGGGGGAPAPGPWTAYPVNAAWRDYSTVTPADGFASPAYRVNNGVVELRGLLDGAAAAGAAVPALPDEAQPVVKRRIVLSSGVISRYDMHPDGVLRLPNGANPTDGFLSLDGASYSL